MCATVAHGASGGTATGKKQGGRRYEIDFLLSLRPKPEGTPRPKGLNPPDRVDILWDGKVIDDGERSLENKLVIFCENFIIFSEIMCVCVSPLR